MEIAEPVFSLGLITDSPKASADWEKAVKHLTRRLMVLREGSEIELCINVVFQLPGNLFQPDFAGLRTGRFSKQKKKL